MRRRLIFASASLAISSVVPQAISATESNDAYQAQFAVHHVARSLAAISELQARAVQGLSSRDSEIYELLGNSTALSVLYLAHNRSPYATEALVDLLYLPLDGSLSGEVGCAIIKKGRPARSAIQKRKAPPVYLCASDRPPRCRSHAEVQTRFGQLSAAIDLGVLGECR